MISSVDPATTGAALMAQSNTTPFTSTNTAGTTQVATSTFLPQSTTTSPRSLTDTLNSLITMLQGLMASIGSLLGGGSAVGGSGSTDSGKFNFLRPVDQEPVTVITTPSPRPGTDTTGLGEVDFNNDTTAVTDEPATAPAPTKKKKKETGSALPKSNGEFLWKPASDKDGKLAILLPKGLTGKVKSVQVLSPDGTKVLGSGKFSGVGNGEREHYRFGKAGDSYPDGAIVVITMQDGSKKHVTIKETSNRTTR